MPFRPNAQDNLTIEGTIYIVAEHPAAPGMPYGQEGRAATVYKLLADGGGEWALKVFKPRFRVPGLVSQAERLAAYARLDGLAVCQRSVLTPQRHAQLLRAQPELLYAVLMPWVQGPTWMQVLIERRELPPETCLHLARELSEVLAGLERAGAAHCDLSGPNVILPMLDSGAGIELVDTEQLFAPGFTKPTLLPAGSSGYAHHAAQGGLWGPDADRFAGAVLLVEMLGWCDERVREAAWGEGYFEPKEMQTDCDRFGLMLRALVARWGDGVGSLFSQAWRSQSLVGCPTFQEWAAALCPEGRQSKSAVVEVRDSKMDQPEVQDRLARATIERALLFSEVGQSERAIEEFKEAYELSKAVAAEPYAKALMQVAAIQETDGKTRKAAETYRQALQILPEDAILREEISSRLAHLEAPSTVLPSDSGERQIEDPFQALALRWRKPAWLAAAIAGLLLTLQLKANGPVELISVSIGAILTSFIHYYIVRKIMRRPYFVYIFGICLWLFAYGIVFLLTSSIMGAILYQFSELSVDPNLIAQMSITVRLTLTVALVAVTEAVMGSVLIRD